ncbi:reverse transcriptase domain-containing protein [Tanacetum coccineum]|uniref:Reverse transcriptase domain-containing protein n=1 Tax=Tanacetum coccineum TaxID=301880 RepID=A0ABQ4XZ85_9ASTR
MTRSSTNELFTPYKEPEREFQSSRRHFKSLSLDELRSPDFNLFSEQEYSEEEKAEAMVETMEQYMKNTFNGSDNEDANEHIEKVLKIVELFHVPNITVDQLMLRVFPISLTRAASRWLRNKPTSSIKTWEDLKNKTLYQAWESFKELLMKCPQHYLTEIQEVILFYNGLDVPTRQILDSRSAVPTKTIADAKKAIQEMAEYSQKWHNRTSRGRSTETSDGLAGDIEQQLQDFTKGTMQILRPKNEGNQWKIRGSVSVMPLLTYLNLGLGELAHIKLIVELADKTVKYPKGIAENILVRIGKFTFPIDFIILDMPEDIKVPLIIGRPFLSTARAKIDVYRRKITLRVGEKRLFSKVAESEYISLDPLKGDYIELNDLNKPFELRRNQGDDLIPIIKECEVIEEFRTRNEDLDTGIDDYPSYCDDDKKIRIDCAHNLKYSCMIGFEFTHVNFFSLLYVNVMFKKFHNSIMKDKMVYKADNVVGALMNVSIFVRTFSIMTDFAVLEDMDAYHDEGIGDVIVGESFLKEVGSSKTV